MKRLIFFLLLCVTLATPAQDEPLPEINDFLYQLQDADLYEISRTKYDLAIIDYSTDGTEAGAYTVDDIAFLQQGMGDPTIVLAYLSIGEAEDYRWYWEADWEINPPDWLDAENPAWEGNYKVRYWDEDWQAIVFAYLDTILEAGFDGVYLDIVDAYEFYEEQGRESSGQEMVDFVWAIADYTHETDRDFFIIPQNGAQLALDYPAYLNAVDGIGQEDMYYGYEDDGEPTPDDVITELESVLDAFVEADKWVLLTAYTTDPDQIADHYTRARERDYIPFATVRALDELTINSGYGPD